MSVPLQVYESMGVVFHGEYHSSSLEDVWNSVMSRVNLYAWKSPKVDSFTTL